MSKDNSKCIKHLKIVKKFIRTTELFPPLTSCLSSANGNHQVVR